LRWSLAPFPIASSADPGEVRSTSRALVVTLLVAAALLSGISPAAGETGALELVSVGSGSAGGQGSQPSVNADVSGDGRYVVFESRARELVPGDLRGATDVFVRDRLLKETTRVSVGIGGAEANGESKEPAISADGEWIAFQSAASNLVPGDTNAATDIFLVHRRSGAITRASVDSQGGQAAGGSERPSISGDGGVVAFTSAAADLVPGDTNRVQDVFVYRRTSKQTSMVSKTHSGGLLAGPSFHPDVSRDGRWVAFITQADSVLASDPYRNYDSYLTDLSAGRTVSVGVGDSGAALPGDNWDARVSADGRYVAFRAGSAVGGPPQIRRFDRTTNKSVLISQTGDGEPGNQMSLAPAISDDGNLIAFHSAASDLVGGDQNGQFDVMVRDVKSGVVNRYSVSPTGEGGNRESYNPVLSGNGGTLVFESLASNLVAGAANGVWDIFAIEGLAPATPDVDPPEMVAFDLLPRAIDVAGADRTVTATMRVVDRSGAVSPRVRLVHTATGATTATVQATAVSGTPTDGNWVATLTLPTPTATGAWTAIVEPLVDSLGHVGPAGPPSTFSPSLEVVDATADTSPPIVTAFSFTPATVGADRGGIVAVTIGLLDASGAMAPTVRFENTASGTSTAAATAVLTAGTASDGTWTASVSVPVGAPLGPWLAILEPVADTAGNLSAVGPPNGFPRQLTVDVNAPTTGTPGSGTPGSGSPGTGTPGGGGGSGGGGTSGGGGGSGGGGSGSVPRAGSGYWMLGATGAVHRFGAANYYGSPRTSLTVESVPARDLEPTPTGTGYWVLDAAGRVHSYGGARHLGDLDRALLRPGETASSLSATPSGKGYWIFTDQGRVVEVGDAEFFGDMSATRLNGPVVDSVATPTGRGYYMVASDGGIFAFGDASFRGSMGGERLNAPVVGLAPTASNRGYWLVASDGGIFAFGDAQFRGSMGGTPLNRPVNGMVAFGSGYLMVATDGGIFNFSGLPFHGSLGANPPSYDIVGVAPLG
jgi:Tol biopolymer transport system component/uncharacterized membrane protein YgcG